MTFTAPPYLLDPHEAEPTRQESEMSDTPCVDGCGQDAATIERLSVALLEVVAERDALRATVVRVEALAEALTTAAKIETQGGEHHAAGLIEAIQADLRAALTPATGPRSAAQAAEGSGQGEAAGKRSRGRTAALCIGCGWCCQSTPRERRGQAHQGCH